MTEPQRNPHEQPAEQAASCQPYQSCESANQASPAFDSGCQQPDYQQPGYQTSSYQQSEYQASGYQQQPGYQAPSFQQAYSPQPEASFQPGALYPMTETDRTLRLVAFVFCIVSLVLSCWTIIPLAWMIPMSVISWGIYKGTKANTIAFDVCVLIFFSLVAGILLLCSHKDR